MPFVAFPSCTQYSPSLVDVLQAIANIMPQRTKCLDGGSAALPRLIQIDDAWNTSNCRKVGAAYHMLSTRQLAHTILFAGAYRRGSLAMMQPGTCSVAGVISMMLFHHHVCFLCAADVQTVEKARAFEFEVGHAPYHAPVSAVFVHDAHFFVPITAGLVGD